MAHSLSASKRVRQNSKRRLRNRSHRSQLRTQVRRFREALAGENADAARQLLPETVSLVDRMIKKGVIHENAGARYKSRLAKRLAAITTS